MWTDLSDDELASRLAHRGLICPSPEAVVADRDEPATAAFITELLGGGG